MTKQNDVPAEPLADDDIGWNRFDNAMLLLLGPLLVYAGFKVGEGWTRYALAAIGGVVGIAVMRGIQAGINGCRTLFSYRAELQAMRPIVQRANAERRAGALAALAEEVRKLPADAQGRLSLTMASQVEHVAAMVDDGADTQQVRQAMEAIGNGETLAETLRR